DRAVRNASSSPPDRPPVPAFLTAVMARPGTPVRHRPTGPPFRRSSPRRSRGQERQFIAARPAPRSGVPHRGHGPARNASSSPPDRPPVPAFLTAAIARSGTPVHRRPTGPPFRRSSPRRSRGQERQFIAARPAPRSGVPHRGDRAVRNASSSPPDRPPVPAFLTAAIARSGTPVHRRPTGPPFRRSSPRRSRGQERQFIAARPAP